MRQPSRIQQVAKWTGTVACAVLAASWAFSLVWMVRWTKPTSSPSIRLARAPGIPVFRTRSWWLQDGVLVSMDAYARTNVGARECWRNPRVRMPGLSRSDQWGLRAPQFSGSMIVSPLWIPLLVVGVPVAWSWRGILRRPRAGVLVLKRKWVLRSWSANWSVLLSVPVFVLAFFAVPYVLGELLDEAFSTDFIDHLCRDLGLPESLVLGVFILVWLILTYAIWLLAYICFRWRLAPVVAVDDAGAPLCPACFYDLTKNVSGICPECGTPIPEDALKRLRE